MACETCGMIPWKRSGRPSCADCTGAGWHVETYGGGRYGSVSWHRWREDAERERERLFRAGLWGGMTPRVEPGREMGAPYQGAPAHRRGLESAKRERCALCGAPLARGTAHACESMPRTAHDRIPGEGC